MEIDKPKTSDAEAQKSLSWGGEIGGGILIVLSLIFIFGGLDLGLGVPTRLGTGAFPFITGLVVLIFAILICIQERKGKGIAEMPDWVGFVAITAAIAIFALTAERFGLVPAVVLSVVIASLPDRNLPLLGKIGLGCIVALVCWGLFIEVLNLPFKTIVGM